MPEKVLCIGTLVLDIFAGPVGGIIRPNTGFGAGIYPREGGNALNVAVGLSKLGYPGGLITLGSVAGKDIYAEMFADYLERHGVNAAIKRIKGAESGKCLIIGFRDKSRAFVGFRGANDKYPAKDVISLIKKIKPGIFYAGETSSLPAVDSGLARILKTAKELGSINVVDYIISSGKPSKQLFRAAKYIDIFHVNDYEAGILTGKKDIKTALKVLLKKGFGFTIITAGEKPLVFAFRGKAYEMPAFHAECKDPTGAGDAFTAGLIKGLSSLPGKTLGQKINCEKRLLGLITLAQAAGAAAVTEVGCTGGISLGKIRSILKSKVKSKK